MPVINLFEIYLISCKSQIDELSYNLMQTGYIKLGAIFF